MVCYHPIVAFHVGTKPNGSADLYFAKDNERLWEYYVDKNGFAHPEYEKLLLPCNRCIGCLKRRSQNWATRMMCELAYHEKACFVTLTYDNLNVNWRAYLDENGMTKLSMTLDKRDFQLFMKKLRKHYSPQKIRFFACGEYGSRTKRPHYHAILYGVDFSEDRYVREVSDDGFVQYNSPTLEKIWDKGISRISEVNFFTCGYVSRYCTKKRYGVQNMYYQTFNIEPEFNLMSRRPGIGYQWYKDNKEELYINQEIFIPTFNGAVKVKPPSYYDKLYDLEYPEESELIKESRKEMARIEMDLKLERKPGMNLFEILAEEEKEAMLKIKAREGVKL